MATTYISTGARHFRAGLITMLQVIHCRHRMKYYVGKAQCVYLMMVPGTRFSMQGRVETAWHTAACSVGGSFHVLSMTNNPCEQRSSLNNCQLCNRGRKAHKQAKKGTRASGRARRRARRLAIVWADVEYDRQAHCKACVSVYTYIYWSLHMYRLYIISPMWYHIMILMILIIIMTMCNKISYYVCMIIVFYKCFGVMESALCSVDHQENQSKCPVLSNKPSIIAIIQDFQVNILCIGCSARISWKLVSPIFGPPRKFLIILMVIITIITMIPSLPAGWSCYGGIVQRISIS